MFVLFNRHSSVTGRALRAALECRGGYLSYMMRRRYEGQVVNWGNSGAGNGPDVLNSGEAVYKAANKLESLRLMKEAGVNVPRFSTNPLDFGDAPVYGRRNSHRGGTDIQVLQGTHSVSVYSDYFTEYVPSLRELRLHIFDGECIGAQLKRYEGEEPEDEFTIRNHANGYVFVPYVNTWPDASRIEAAKAAVAAHGLDFGAVDALVDKDGNTVVLEVNTAPGLSERFLNLYKEAIQNACQ